MHRYTNVCPITRLRNVATPATALLCLLAMAATAAVPSVSAAEPLRWKFNKGERFRYDMRQKMTNNVSVGGGQAGTITTNMDQEMNMFWTIEDVNSEGNATIVQEFDRIKMTMGMPGGQSFSYDTDSDEAPEGIAAMVAPMLKAMSECQIRVVMTPQGEILEATVPEKFVKALQDAPGAQMMGDMATAEGLANISKQASMKFPAGDLVEGTSEEATIEIKNPMFGKQIVKSKFTYKGITEVGGETFEAFTPSINMSFAKDEKAERVAGDDETNDAEQPQQPAMPTPTDFKVTDQSTDGEVLFDREAGRLASSHVEQKFTMQMMMGEQMIETKVDQTIDVKVKPIGVVDTEE